jgi:hypothetical protein
VPDADRVQLKLTKKNPTPSLLRTNPAALACLERERAHPFQPTPLDPPDPPLDPGIGGDPTIETKLSELIGSIKPAEDPSGGRADQGALAANIANLRLSKGPADVPAFYDFHNLQIAFDHVWEDARAEGVIEKAKVMYRKLVEMGGDPKSALDGERDPFRALRKELGLVRQAHANLSVQQPTAFSLEPESQVVYIRPPPLPNGTGGSHEPPPRPPRPPQPPPRPQPPDVDPTPDQGLDNSYPFTLFADKSINFGLLVTYRQCWEPTTYQVGRLVGTQSLAPKESISITSRQVVKTTFNQKQVEASQEIRRREAEDTQRDEAEIVSRAQSKSNFALTTQGSYKLGPLGEGSYTTAFGRDAETNSQETKRSMRQAVQKASEEYRNEHRMELDFGTSTETENVQKREISNPNDELAMTYLFYELQRRYVVSERLHRITPVVLVGQHVPPPHEINDDWVRRYDWIIKRFLPDDSYRSALTYLATRERGDSIILSELATHMSSLRDNVRDLKHEILRARHESASRYAIIEQVMGEHAALETEEDTAGFLERAFEAVRGTDEKSKDALRILEDSAREGYERAVREERDLRARIESEVTALQAATDAYTKAKADYTSQRLQIDRLIRHVIDNIIHYMHGIWSYEQPDQRMFRHHTLAAPRLRPLARNYTLEPVSEFPVGIAPQPGKTCYRVTFTTRIDDDVESAENNATLAELADLDRPLGFKGNYIIYPLNESNALTDFMLTPYLDAETGLRDPDELGNWTLREFSDYVDCLRNRLTPAEFEQVELELRRQYQALLADPLRDGEEIVVPTTSLYMQMIVDPGKALEDFKAAHRLIDVLKVKADLRGAEIDNLRKAKLILASQLADPNIESVKNVYYHGSGVPHDGEE